MKTQELLKYLGKLKELERSTERTMPGEIWDEIIQRLREYNELRDLIRQVAVPSQKIAEFLGYKIK